MSTNIAQEDFIPGPLPRRSTFQVPVWNERNLLALDGGGVRGYWSLLMLEKLMRAIGEEEYRQAEEAKEDVRDLHSFLPQALPPNVTQCPRVPKDGENSIHLHAQRFLPCHYFDLICGSSTGSLIAIMLCRFRMTVQDCLQEYKKMSQVIFGNPRWISQRNIGIVRWPKYSAKAMEKAFKEVTERREQRPIPRPDQAPSSQFGTKTGTCSMFATTYRRKKGKEASSDKPHLLRSYNHPEREHIPRKRWKINFGSEGHMDIWMVARAATAAPMYFREVKIKLDRGEKVYYSDGGFGQTNNPTLQGIYELETLHRRKNGKNGDAEVIQGSIGVIVSIGTARADDQPGGKSIFKRVKKAFSRATDPQDVAGIIDYQERPNCWRLNDEKGLNMELDDWKPNKFTRDPGHKSLQLMQDGFNRWAADEGNIQMLRDCARELVRRRRRRTKDRSKWERFATVAEFRCTCSECHDSAMGSRDDFEEHFNHKHAHQPDEHSFETPEVRTWTYPSPSSSRSSTGI